MGILLLWHLLADRKWQGCLILAGSVACLRYSVGGGFVQPIPPASIICVVAEFFGSNGTWDTAGFVELVPNVVFQEIIVSLPRHLSSGPDFSIWGRTTTRIYTTSSAYELLTTNVKDTGQTQRGACFGGGKEPHMFECSSGRLSTMA